MIIIKLFVFTLGIHLVCGDKPKGHFSNNNNGTMAIKNIRKDIDRNIESEEG